MKSEEEGNEGVNPPVRLWLRATRDPNRFLGWVEPNYACSNLCPFQAHSGGWPSPLREAVRSSEIETIFYASSTSLAIKCYTLTNKNNFIYLTLTRNNIKKYCRYSMKKVRVAINSSPGPTELSNIKYWSTNTNLFEKVWKNILATCTLSYNFLTSTSWQCEIVSREIR